MLRILLLFLLSTSFGQACRTVKDSGSAGVWASEDNRNATVVFIKKTVTDLFPDVSADDPALAQFAVALQDKDTKQTESAQFILSKYLEQRAQSPDDTNTEAAAYITEQFLAMTNYIAVYKREASSLAYIGYEGSLPSKN